jgi:hypothetical protein
LDPSAPWSLPLTSLHLFTTCHHLCCSTLTKAGHAVAWQGHPHAISSPGHLQPEPPCPLASPHSPGHAQPQPRRKQAPETSAHTRPDTPRTRPCRARARLAPTLDAQSVTTPHASASPPPSLSAPVDVQRHTAPPGHARWPAGTPQVTNASTPIRHCPRAPVKLPAAVAPRFPHNQARQLRMDVANTPSPRLGSSRPWTDGGHGEPSRAPQPPLAAIKGGLLRPN